MPRDPIDDPRREFLVRALGAGLFAIGGPHARAAHVGRTPAPMAEGESVFDLEGEVTVNGRPATAQTRISANDTVSTGSNGRAIFVVGKDAFMLRGNSRVEMTGTKERLLSGLRMLSGKLLSVFGRRDASEQGLRLATGTVSMGIRGTGVYVEADPDLSYVCTCYGVVDLAAVDDPQSSERIVSEHHDSPRYITREGASGSRIRPAPFLNHTDTELRLIETLVGREVPFGIEGAGYGRPRKDY